MKKTISEVVHQSVKGLHKAGLVNVETMRTFDALCAPPVRKLNPKTIKKNQISM